MKEVETELMTWVLKGSHLCVQNHIYDKKHSNSNSYQMTCNDAIYYLRICPPAKNIG